MSLPATAPAARLAVTVAVAALALGGCGGGDAVDEPEASSGRAPAPVAEADPAERDAGRAADPDDEASERGSSSEEPREQSGGESSAQQPREERERPRPRSRSRSTPESERQGRALLDAATTVVKRYFEALDRNDTEVCTALMTQRFLEQITTERGRAAVARCRRDVAGADAGVELVEIEDARVEAGEGHVLVQARSRIGDRSASRIYRIVSEDRSLKIDELRLPSGSDR